MIFQYPIKHFQHTLLIDIPLNMVSNCIICFAFLWVLSHPGGFMSFYLWFHCISPAARVTLKQESSFYTLIMCRRFFFFLKAMNMRHSCTRRQVLWRSQGGWTAVIGAHCCRIVTLTALGAELQPRHDLLEFASADFILSHWRKQGKRFQIVLWKAVTALPPWVK